MGELICRDNLEVLCEWYAQGKREFIDLIYIDPPFGNDVDKVWNLKWKKIEDYTNWMYPRVFLMREMLKPTGTFYYHCDPTASHYVKMMLDMIFGMENFKNEIIWQYFMGGKSKNFWGSKHDVILFYTKTRNYTFNVQKVKRYLDFVPSLKDSSKNAEVGKDDIGYYSIVSCPDVWPIKSVFNMSKEWLSYPTQKPEKLLERIILASSNPKDLVVDFYLGGGTTVAVSERLDRNWIGIDINPRAIELSKNRV